MVTRDKEITVSKTRIVFLNSYFYITDDIMYHKVTIQYLILLSIFTFEDSVK